MGKSFRNIQSEQATRISGCAAIHSAAAAGKDKEFYPAYRSSLPLSNGPSDRVSFFFSNNWNTKFPQGLPHNWCLLPQLQVSLISRKIEKEKKQSKRKSSKEHNKSLSLNTKAFMEFGRGFDHLGVSCIECLALVSGWKLENLDDLNVG